MSRISGPNLALLMLMLMMTDWIAPRDAHAFRISDHERITRVALDELERCGAIPSDPDTASTAFFESVIQGDIDEDLDLVRKWSYYSHYYHPLKEIEMRRADSSATVLESEAALRQGRAVPEDLRAELLGRVIHHIQDSAAPVHVVPVSHWLTDGFESLEVAIREPSEPGAREATPDCRNLLEIQARTLRAESLLDILKGTALGTLATLDEAVPYRRAGMARTTRWKQAFWKDAEGPVFGDYGAFGNSFGETSFWYRGDRVEIDAAVFVRYKRARLRAAVEATQAVWFWYLKRL